MIQRTLKRTLSIFLALVLIATTFFIFDPSTLKLDAKAWLDVENLEQSGRPEVEFLVPETIYVDQDNHFKYYVDSDITGGLIRNPEKTTGQVFFESSIPCSSISITYKAETGSAAGIKFNIKNGSSGVTSCSITNAGSLDAQIVYGNSSSGTVIKWTAECTKASFKTGEEKTFYSYAYTYVYRVAEQAVGTVNATSGNILGTTSNATAYSMATGFHSIGTSQAYSSALTGVYNPLNIPIGSDTLGSISTDGNNVTNVNGIPFKKTSFRDDDNIDDTKLSPIITHTAGGVYWGGYRDGTQNWEQSTENTWPTASITIDKSRYTNTNQIPFLQMVEYWSRLDYEKDINSEMSYSFDKSNYTNFLNTAERGDSNKSDGHVRYTSARINSPVQSSSYTLYLKHKMHYDTTNMGSHVRNSTSYKKISVTVVDKAALRAAYRLGCNTAYTSSEASEHAADIDNLKTMGTNLGNPTSITTTTYETPVLKNFGDSAVNSPEITFYVPEIIYLAPAASASTFQYYYDYNTDGTITKGYKNTSTGGNVYFYCPDASSVSISYSGMNNPSIGSLSGTTTVNTQLKTGSTSSAVTQGNTSQITWTATYVVGGKTYTAKTYTTCYAPLASTNSTVNFQFATLRGKGAWSKSNREILNISYWMTGITRIDEVSSYTSADVNTNTSYISPPLTVSTVVGKSGSSTGLSQGNTLDGCYVSATGNKGYHGYYTDDDGKTKNVTCRYKAVLNYDPARMENTSQVPNFSVGIDIHENWGGDGDGTNYWSLGYYKSGATANNNNIVGLVSSSGNNDNRVKGRVSNTHPSITFEGTQSYILSGYAQCQNNGTVNKGNITINFDFVSVDKSELRTLYFKELKIGRQQGWYDEGWSAYETAMKTASERLGSNNASAGDITDAKDAIKSAVAGLKNTIERTAHAYHRSNASGNKLLQDEYIAYHRGDNVTAGSNEYTGYTYASVTPATGATNANPSVANNTTETALNWTFWYTPKTYNVVYNKGDATGGITANVPKTATYDADFKVGDGVPKPTKTGATFTGWLFNGNGNTYNINDTFLWTYDDANLNFTPTWQGHKYTVKFNANGGTVSTEIPDIAGCEYGKTYTLFDASAYISRAGFNFLGWSTSSTATTATYENKGTFSNLTAENNGVVTLYAVWSPKTYTVTLHAMTENLDGTFSESTTGGTVSGGGTKNYGAALSVSKTANPGFTADSNWYGNSGLSQIATPSSTVTGNLEYWAKFTRNKYNITFDNNYSGGGSSALNGKAYGSTITVPVPSRAGYVFGGWYTETGCTNQMYSASTTSATVGNLGNNNTSVTYYAKWTANTINYAYNANGGSETMEGGSFSYGSSFIAAANGFTAPASKVVTLDADGGSVSSSSVSSTYTFSKWNTKANGSGTNVNPGATVYASTFGITSGTGTLYAQWTQNGATLPTPVRQGYTFNGWYTAKNGGGTKRESGYLPTASETLYASWSVGEYTLSLYAYGNSIANTGNYTSGVGGTVSGAGKYTYEQAISISATPATGYKLVGWYTDSTFATPAGTLPTKMPGEHKTFVAKFSIVYCTVKAYAYSTSNGTSWANNTTGGTVKVAAGTTGTAGATSEGKVITGNSATVTATPATGYHFVGWYDSATVSGSTSATSNPLTVAFTSEGATINKYARFDINQNTLTVNPDGGSVKVGGTDYTATKSFTQNGGTTLSIAVPTKAGYTFAGWTKSPSTLNGTLSSTTAAATYTFASNVFGQTDTITATWTPNSYSIKFNANAATAIGSMSDLPMTYGTAKNLTAVGFTNTGYTFAGWATSSTGAVVYADKASVNNLTTTPNGTVQLYAKWTINKYTITLHPMTEAVNGSFSESTTGGTVAGGGTYDYNTSLSITATAKTGYTFAGWFSNSGMTTSATAPTKATANTELWAKFTLNQYEVRVSALANTAAATGTFNATNASNAGCTVSTSAATAKHGTSVTLTATAGAGYTFVGWYDNEACTGSAVGSTPTITANKTFYAKFTVKTSTVKVNAYSNATGSYAQNTTGGTVKVEGVSPAITAAQSITMGYKGSYKVTATPATGYTFDGWFTDEALTVAATGATASDTYTATFTKKDANENLYAKFTISTPKVTVYAYSNTAGSTNYNNNTTGGTVKIASGAANASATANVNYGSTVNITATPATGYQFDGWYSAVTGGNNGAVITAWTTQLSSSATAQTESVTQARTYYAKFTAKSINVTFNTAGGSISSGNATAKAYYGSALTPPTVTRQGYKLLGWDENSAATTATYPVSSIGVDAVNTMVLAGTDKTLYAIWEPFNYTIYLAAASDTANNIGSYIVGSNGSSTGGSIAYKSGITKINVGDDILSCLDIQVNPGYELVDVKYKEVSSAPSAGSNVTTWSNANSVYSTGFDKMVEFADNAKIAFIAYFRVCQYTATAHAYSNNTAPYTTYANNAIGGTVKLGETGAAGKEAIGSAYSGDTNGVTFYATVKAGYTFDGWFDNEACTGTAFSTSTTYKVVFSGSDVDLYAKFSINTYKAYARAKYYTAGADEATGAGYNGINGGTATVSVGTTSQTTTDINAVYVEAKYHEIVTYTASPATGYTFAGWYKCDDTSDDVDIEDAIAEEVDTTYSVFINGEDVRYHAKFVPVNFILVLNPNGGTGSAAVSGSIAEVTLTYGQGIVLDENAKPTRASYSFAGWAESSSATTPDYNHSDSTCTISVDKVNTWYNQRITVTNSDGEIEKEYHEIFAVWEIATYTVILDDNGGTGGQGQVTVTLNQPMPALDKIPTYDGYKFKGYYLEPDGADESGKYYTADGASAQNWNIADGKTLYAKWVCPVLMDAEYDESTGKWTYIYEDTTGKEVSADPTDAILTKEGLTENAPDTAKELSVTDKTKPGYVKDKVEETKDINLNHYTTEALEGLLENVKATNDDTKRSKLSQIKLNEYVANIANFIELGVAGNKKTETVKPSIKLYETKSKIKSIKDETLTKELSVIGENYAKPSSNESGTYLYNDKYCYYTDDAVDYYIYTNSLTPVIAIEIDDGVVGTTVENNNSSYPTNAAISADCKASVVTNKDSSYMNSAVAATDNISDAWFSRYTEANIGINTDYNAKQVLYLTPTFTNSDTLSTTNEIVYTITPTDDAAVPNQGTTATELAQIPEKQKDSFSALNTKEETGESITVCVCYHNAMNGTSDKGGELEEGYFQMYIDQIDADNQYYDTWLNQMHLFRQSGGANNWEVVLADEDVYPVEDETFKDTGYVLGSFAYVFDASNEPVAAAYASSDLVAAEKAIISSIKDKVTECQAAIIDRSSSNNINGSGTGLGFFSLGGWSTNFYPAQGSYVYAHVVDRWGNYFNKVWKCFNVDDYTPFITGKASIGYNIFEDGGSNLSAITIKSDDVEFITDLDSTYEDGIFTTVDNTFTISTGKPSTKLRMSFIDNAGNELVADVKTDTKGNMTFIVDDACADLTSGAYTFMLNDQEVNLCAGEPALIRDASMPGSVFCDESTTVTVKTDDRATKVQLVENGVTRTYYIGYERATVVDNGDGTLTWTLLVTPLAKGEHTFEIKGKDSAGWHDSSFTVSTDSIEKPVYVETALLAVSGTKVAVGENATIKVETIPGTEKVRVLYNSGATRTVDRNDEIETTEDGTEIWTINVGSFVNAGDNTVSVIAKNNKLWQTDNAMNAKIDVYEVNIARPAEIYAVNLSKENVKRSEKITAEVLTNSEAIKVQYIAANAGTITFTADNAQIVENEDGTLSWTVVIPFYTVGDNDVAFRAKSSLGWAESDVYGNVTVTK